MNTINFEHINFLRPLSNWRILDIDNLIFLSKGNKYKSYDSARLLLKSLERKKIIKIYREPWNKKNYIFLSEIGEKLITPDNPNFLKEESFYHDSKVTALCFEIIKANVAINSVELEHQIRSFTKRNIFEEVIPDAKLQGYFNGRQFVAAFELELHQKEKKRIINKVKSYLNSTYYNHAFYFFPDFSLMQIYLNVLQKEFGQEFNQKVFLFVTDSLSSNKPKLKESYGLVSGKEMLFLDLFKENK
ncbi:MAG: hypothetical protein L6Q33_14650 [Bacteriovoracaceae bacterium]|nr:hypothetical protein [Bacteriovoracaceae bacterium]